jgi:general secretion pathway protein C
VYADRVLLDRNGQLEALMLPRQFTPGTAAAPPPRPQPNQFAENLRQIAQTNPGALTEIIRPQPVYAGGQLKGFRVYPGRNRQQFAQLGLRPGDLIQSINGTPLDDPRSSAEIFNTISSSDRVTVGIERAGQTQELTLNTAQIQLPSAEQPVEGGMPGRPMQGMRRPSNAPEAQ